MVTQVLYGYEIAEEDGVGRGGRPQGVSNQPL